MPSDLVEAINFAYSVRANPLVIALTGRTGSGCSSAATSLGREISELSMSEDDFPQPEKRKMAILLDFARKHWVPFAPITVSSVIYSFLLEEAPSDVNEFLVLRDIPETGRDEMSEHLTNLRADPSFYAFKKAMTQEASAQEMASAWHFFSTTLSPLAMQSRRVLGQKYAALFQVFGDNVRCSGKALESVIRPERLFVLMDRVRQLIRCVEAFKKLGGGVDARVVVDAIRNPLELVYLRKHLAGLLVIAITADDKERRARLLDGALSKKDVDAIDAKEYDGEKHLTNYESFVSQNLKDCIQKADIFVANPGSPGQLASSIRFMNAQLIRYVALALRPGLVTPTRDERCMQIGDGLKNSVDGMAVAGHVGTQA